MWLKPTEPAPDPTSRNSVKNGWGSESAYLLAIVCQEGPPIELQLACKVPSAQSIFSGTAASCAVRATICRDELELLTSRTAMQEWQNWARSANSEVLYPNFAGGNGCSHPPPNLKIYTHICNKSPSLLKPFYTPWACWGTASFLSVDWKQVIGLLNELKKKKLWIIEQIVDSKSQIVPRHKVLWFEFFPHYITKEKKIYKVIFSSTSKRNTIFWFRILNSSLIIPFYFKEADCTLAIRLEMYRNFQLWDKGLELQRYLGA